MLGTISCLLLILIIDRYNANGPLLSAFAIVGYQGCFGGYQTELDTPKSKATTNNPVLGFSMDDFILHTNIDYGQKFHGSIYQKVSLKLQTIQLRWTAGSSTRFGFNWARIEL